MISGGGASPTDGFSGRGSGATLPPMTQPIELHVTCGSREEARALGKAAVEARLVACANVTGPVESLFHWQGKVETEEEWQLACKTHAGVLDDLIALLRDRHSYDLPVITWAAVGAEADAAAWIRDETGA
jgi:periplasmic divalent cation tolerance protein